MAPVGASLMGHQAQGRDELVSPSRLAMRLLFAEMCSKGGFPVCSVESLWWCVVSTLEPQQLGFSLSGSGEQLGMVVPPQGSQPSPAPLQALSPALAFLTSVSPGNRLSS